MNRDVQIASQLANNRQLLVILLAEIGDVGQSLDQQLCHDRRHAVEVAGTVRAAEALRQSVHSHQCGKTGRVDFIQGGKEHEIDTGGLQHFRGRPPRGEGRSARSSVGANCFGLTKIVATTRSHLGPRGPEPAPDGRGATRPSSAPGRPARRRCARGRYASSDRQLPAQRPPGDPYPFTEPEVRPAT